MRVVTLICKDRHEETILEGLKCLRVSACFEGKKQTLFNDNRIHLIDIHDWVELIQLLLFPTVKDTINNIMSIRSELEGKFMYSRIVTLPRGNKIASSSVISAIIEVRFREECDVDSERGVAIAIT